MWPRRQDTVSRPARKPTALCPVDGLCFAWVPSARAKRHSREEESYLPVRPWSAVDPYFEPTPTQLKATVKRVRLTHLAADHHQFLSATSSAGSTASTPISPDIHEQIGASSPFHVEDGPGHQGPHRRRPGRSADTPGARAGEVLNQKERSQPTPVAVARCGNRHVGGGRCASSRSIP
jgi:hypothetical protein